MPPIAVDTANEMSQGEGTTTTPTPSYEEIAVAAYHIYLERGGLHGRDFDDWLDAERSLRTRR